MNIATTQKLIESELKRQEKEFTIPDWYYDDFNKIVHCGDYYDLALSAAHEKKQEKFKHYVVSTAACLLRILSEIPDAK